MTKKSTLSRMLRLTRGTTIALSLAVMLAAGLLLSPARSAQAQQPPPQGTADANCSGPLESYHEARGQRMAQTFTAQNSGELTSAQLEVYEDPSSSNDYVLAIHAVDASDVPTNTVLASATVPDPTASGDMTITGNFADPATVEAGQQYALVVKKLGPDYLGLGIRVGDDCPGKVHLSGSGTDPFTDGLSNEDLVFATYVTVNEPPLASDDTYKVKNNRTLRVGPPGTLGNDSDPNGHALTTQLVSGPGKGRLTLGADGSFTYKPKRNFRGVVAFIYEVNDGRGGTDQARVTIRIR